MAKFWNEYGLTFKQFQFCTEYLRHGNADEAYRTVYSVNNRNSTNILKSRNIQNYLRKRLNDSMVAAEVNQEYLLRKLKEKADSTNDATSLEALKILQVAISKKQELESKLSEVNKSLENNKDVGINITITEIKKEKE